MDKVIRNKRILVTGGAGFIGSNLIESLLDAGNTVVCLDNFITGKRKNIEDFTINPRFTAIEGDIRDYETCIKAVNGAELVFHEAALGSVPRSVADPVSSVDVNIGGFVKILTASKEAGVKRFIYASSSSVYGDNQRLPKLEDETGVQLSPYAITKYADELFASNFASIYGIEVIGLRYFNVFGRRQDPDGPYAAVIPKFLKQLREHTRPVINGNGSNSRDFTYVNNVIEANHLAGLIEDEKAINQVYNIAFGARTTLIKLYEIIRKLAGRHDSYVLDIEPVFGPDRAGDIPHSEASVEKARMLLGYRPSSNLAQGLREAIPWYWNNL